MFGRRMGVLSVFLLIYSIFFEINTLILTITHLDVCPVHVGPADVGWPVPLAEEHVAPVGMNHDGTRPLQILEQRPPVVLHPGAQHVQRA